jgi:beta-phosphoglucomutase-like phosphatase (HAD superfamily)
MALVSLLKAQGREDEARGILSASGYSDVMARRLERELEMTIQLLVSTKVVARPKTAPGGGTVAADQLQLHQASAIKLLEC